MSPRTWFITGCSSGFGRELALEAMSRGDTVIATARKLSALLDLETAGAKVMELDVTAPPQRLKDVAADVIVRYGRLDVLVNNAGYMVEGTIEELGPEATQRQFDTNVFGLLNVTRAFMPFLRAQRAGVIANMSSVAAWRGTPALGIYAASKWAVTAINETLHAELAPFGIQVCSIEPGYFRSNFLTSGNRVVTQPRIPDYNGNVARQNAERWDKADHFQPGDVTKAAKVIVDVVTQTGSARERPVPLRLVLGTDAFDVIQGKCQSTMALLHEWEAIIKSTNHEAAP